MVSIAQINKQIDKARSKAQAIISKHRSYQSIKKYHAEYKRLTRRNYNNTKYREFDSSYVKLKRLFRKIKDLEMDFSNSNNETTQLKIKMLHHHNRQITVILMIGVN